MAGTLKLQTAALLALHGHLATPDTIMAVLPPGTHGFKHYLRNKEPRTGEDFYSLSPEEQCLYLLFCACTCAEEFI